MAEEIDPLVKKAMEGIKITFNEDFAYNRFMRKIGEGLKMLEVEPKEFDPRATIVTLRAIDFDPAQDLWRMEENKSQVRPDVQCSICKHTLAMSNGMYANYMKTEPRPTVLCTPCFITKIQESADGG